MIEMCVMPEKVGKDMRLFNVVEAPGNSIPANQLSSAPPSGVNIIIDHQAVVYQANQV
jgi:hypothetical protein